MGGACSPTKREEVDMMFIDGKARGKETTKKNKTVVGR
jgi:hypothetical protein